MLDWLTDGELGVFFERHGGADYLHTFSERRGRIRQAVQRLVRAADAVLRPNAVRPRFMRLDRLVGLFPASRRDKIFVLRDPGLRDAVFISSLPLRGAKRTRGDGAVR